MNKPFEYRLWNDPKAAFAELGKERALNLYLTQIEPEHAHDPRPYVRPEWDWRQAFVKYRDRYICGKCGQRKTEASLHVHHVEHLGWNLPSPNRLENLITLCCWCHKKEHRGKFMRC